MLHFSAPFSFRVLISRVSFSRWWYHCLWCYLFPEIHVTSSKRRHKNSMKCAIAKFLNQDGRPDRYWKLKRMMENSANHPPPYPRENTPSQKYPRNRRVVPSPSEDVPAASRTRRMAQEMKKLRSLHILHVPPSRSKTKAR